MVRLTRVSLNLRSIYHSVRGQCWWHYKIPPLLAMAYLFVLWQTPAPDQALPAIAGILVSLCSVAAFGYVINDIFDIEEDRKAGKANLMSQWKNWQKLGLCLALIGAGFSPWLLVGFSLAASLVLAANFALPLAYSIPPLRLKERGLAGVAADAAGVSAVPTLFMAFAIIDLNSSIQTGFLLIAVATIWAFAAGFRGILIHQLLDWENDVRAGIITFANSRDSARIVFIIRWLVFPLEILALIALALTTWPFAPVMIYAMVGYMIFDLGRYMTWKRRFDPVPDSPGVYIPPADFYDTWLPMILATTLATMDPWFLVIPALHLMLFYGIVKLRLAEFLSIASTWLRY